MFLVIEEKLYPSVKLKFLFFQNCINYFDFHLRTEPKPPKDPWADFKHKYSDLNI